MFDSAKWFNVTSNMELDNNITRDALSQLQNDLDVDFHNYLKF